jgi:endonuclease YncB( thermonuclease family)
VSLRKCAARWLSVAALLICHAPGPAIAASARNDAPAVLAGKVTRVIDGDTLDVQLTSGRIRVRLHGVDAPESDQPGGKAAATWLAQQLQDQQVMLEPVTQDQYVRMVAIVHLKNRVINHELVATGNGWAYRQYLRRGDEDLCRVEERARRRGTGIWATTARAPWEYRATRGKGPFRDYSKSSSADCRKAIGRAQPGIPAVLD